LASTRLLAIAALLVLAASPALADCGPPISQPVTAPTPPPFLAHPFGAAISADDCTVYVALANSDQGTVVLLARSGDGLPIAQTLAVPGRLGMAKLTHDGAILVVTTNTGVAFIDTAKFAVGASGALVGAIGGMGGAIGLVISNDDHTVFVANETKNMISVIDLEKARASGYGPDDVIGEIPTDTAPVGLVVSPDNKLLYSTSEIVANATPATCPRPRGTDLNPQGSLAVIDIDKARSTPATAVLGKIIAGCSPVRVALSPAGDRAYVTARADNVVNVYDAAKLLSDPTNAKIASVPVGIAPVGIAVTADGTRIAVADSDRFGTDKLAPGTVTFIDAAKVADGQGAVLGTVQAGAFPRELSFLHDGTLTVTNFRSSNLLLFPPGTPLTPPAAAASPAPSN
jgi:DNA-binding beta-propeller fold protein YncE